MKLYQIFRDGRPFAAPNSCRAFLEYGAKKLKEAHQGNTWEVKEVKTA